MAYIRVRYITQKGFISASIRWVTRSLISHCEFGTPEFTWIGAHSSGGVQERAWDYCKTSLNLIYDIPCTDEQQADHLKWIRSKIGIKYNFMDIAGILINAHGLTSPNRLICSQFVTEGLLRTFGPTRYLNVLDAYSYRVTPEMSHLSPLLAGHRVFPTRPIAA